MACHAARRASATPLTDAQLRALLGELDRADFHPTCSHGTVVVLEMPLLELGRRASAFGLSSHYQIRLSLA